MIAVVGHGHGTGKATLLKILGGALLPTAGHAFIPAHLRTLHVSYEPVVFDVGPYDNLVFGSYLPSDVSPERLREILNALGMHTVLQIIDADLKARAFSNQIGRDDSRISGSCTGSDTEPR